MPALRRLAPIALLSALHAATPASLAFADPPKPSGSAASRQGPDLIARGQSLFDDQEYEESIQTLSGALVRPNNTKPQRLEIYRLLALNYITLNRKDEAESAVRGLLAQEPTYELPARESPRFRDFFAATKQKWEAEGRPGLVRESQAPLAPVKMRHSSPSKAEAHTQIDLTATLEDPAGRVKEVKLFHRVGSSGKFEESQASLDGTHVSTSIPPDAVKGPIVEYYLEGIDGGGLPVVSRGDAAAPLRIAIPEGGGGWVLPVAISGSVLGAAAIVGVLAAAGVFKSSSSGGGDTTKTTNPPPPGGSQSTVNVSVGASSFGARW
jgi:hypothetical protein